MKIESEISQNTLLIQDRLVFFTPQHTHTKKESMYYETTKTDRHSDQKGQYMKIESETPQKRKKIESESTPQKRMKIDQSEKTYKRYALLLAAKDSEYVKKMYGGYFNVFVKAFGDEEYGEKWDLFRVVDGEFPNMDELIKYEGFVVSGSPFDAYGNEHWILKLCLLLQTLYLMHKKVLGICFGHQVLCRALGGKVGKANNGWDIGLRKLSIVKDFSTHSFLSDLEEIPIAISIIECHQDEVWEVPKGAKIVAISEKTNVEMFTMGEHILGIQGHPEYTKDILSNLIDRLLSNGSIESGFAEDSKTKLYKAEPDRKCLEKICKKFLKRDLEFTNGKL